MALPTTSDLTNLPAKLKRARKAAGYSNAKDFLAAIKATGRKAPSYSTYAQWESGEVSPRDETIEPIVDYHNEHGTWPEDRQEIDLISALAAQTDAINRQAAAMEAASVASSSRGDTAGGDELAALLKAVTDLVGELQQERNARASIESRLTKVEATMRRMAATDLARQGTPAPAAPGAPQT